MIELSGPRGKARIYRDTGFIFYQTFTRHKTKGWRWNEAKFAFSQAMAMDLCYDAILVDKR